MTNKKQPAEKSSSVDKAIDRQNQTDIDQVANQAEKETKTRKPGESNGHHNGLHNNGRGGGK